MSRAPVTAETVATAFVCLGKVETATPAGIRLLASEEDLAGLDPADWIERERRRHGIVEPWDTEPELGISA